MTLLLLFRGEIDEEQLAEFSGTETTTTWAHLLRESKIPEAPEDDYSAGMVSMDRLRERVSYGR